jgi:uncharacterized protein YbjT (DUF2867 family)
MSRPGDGAIKEEGKIMRVLVIGGNGKVGRPLVGRLLACGAAVRVLTRSAERASMIDRRAQPVVADIADDPSSAMAAFVGVDAVYMLNQPTFRETAEGLLAVEIARSAGVGRFVYQSVFRVEDLAYLPHVAPKWAIQRALMQSGMQWTVLSPNHFFQNDHMTRAGLLERGEYTLPVGTIGCSSVDAEDIAAAATSVLTSEGHEGRNYAIVGPRVLTGQDCAQAWSQALGRDVQYAGDVERWREQMKPAMPAWLNFDLALMYRDFARRGFVASEGEVAQMHELLGRPPRPYEDYVRMQAAEWTAARPA